MGASFKYREKLGDLQMTDGRSYLGKTKHPSWRGLGVVCRQISLFYFTAKLKKKKSTKLKFAFKSDFCQTTFADGC